MAGLAVPRTMVVIAHHVEEVEVRHDALDLVAAEHRELLGRDGRREQQLLLPCRRRLVVEGVA